ncbi:hypothetical protein VR7878_02343 [Vibrio ruber DSM 16370]|uniref:Uncharacterized protein n=1 Tax=Vibrio ruber (strain DSM 16370 / JCM 11486 / BCRC 17186 / CECT 7878 / LMG 23124 / VR1) TaxID=1123498 RepID=A0A1R4LM12_VIBR1|nr:hypothetical protein VR7878_02343 [Vibrio ruber DSM 16370]
MRGIKQKNYPGSLLGEERTGVEMYYSLFLVRDTPKQSQCYGH